CFRAIKRRPSKEASSIQFVCWAYLRHYLAIRVHHIGKLRSGVVLRRTHLDMPKDLLHLVNRHPACEQMRCKAMSKAVRRHAVSDACPFSQIADAALDALLGHAAAKLRLKDPGIRVVPV